MLSIFMLTACSSLVICAGWCLTAAKRNVPITRDDAKVMWVMHRKSGCCAGHKWQPITRKEGKIIGFQCECGYKYTQKRPLVSKMAKHNGVPNVGNKIYKLR